MQELLALELELLQLPGLELALQALLVAFLELQEPLERLVLGHQLQVLLVLEQLVRQLGLAELRHQELVRLVLAVSVDP